MKIEFRLFCRGVNQVYLDEEPWRKLHIAVFGFKPVLPARCANLSEFELQFQTLEYGRVKNYVFRRLASQSYSSVELAKKLQEKEISKPIISKVLNEIKSLGYLNDKEWLESFVRSQLAKNVSFSLIKMKLRAKGFSEQAVEDLLNSREEMDGGSQKNHILRLIKTKYRNRKFHELKEKQKVIASLMRKGFVFDEIKEAINEYTASTSM